MAIASLNGLMIVPPLAHGGPTSARREKGDVLPASADAERSILGAVLADNDCLYEVASEIISDHFALDSHRRIFGAMINIREQQKHIDSVTLSDELSSRGELQRIGGVAYLSELEDGALSAKRYLADHVRILKEKASLRWVINVGNELVARAIAQTETAEKLIAQCEVGLQEILAESAGRQDGLRRLGDFADEVFEGIESIRSYKQELIGLSYGLPNVNFATTGARKGETSVIGGRPGAGKSSFGLGIAISNGEDQTPVYYCSAEMKGAGLFSRTLSAITKVNNFKIRDPRQMSAEDEKQIRIAKQAIDLLPVYVDDRPGLHLSQILATARLGIKKLGIKLCIFDYAQIIKADGRDMKDRVGNVAEAVAMFARANDVHCVLLSQITRPDRKNANVRPSMDDLKESGRLEENADLVGLLFRAVGEHEGEDEFIIAKQRNGPVGTEKVYFNKETLLYHQRS